MNLIDEILVNFKFITLEVTKQVEDTFKALERPNDALIDKINARDDYIDNLKSVIENGCFSRIATSAAGLDQREMDKLRATNIIGNNLERIADFAVNIVGQMQHFTDLSFIRRYDYKSMFTEIIHALNKVETALLRRDFTLALQICRCEFTLDRLYKQQFDRIMNEFRGSGERPENLITAIFIFRYLERMGDSLQNVGEAIVFAIVGEKFKIHQYDALKDAMAKTGMEFSLTESEFQSIWGTRSGCRIGKLESRPKGDEAQEIIFKEGKKRKIIMERDNIKRWELILPGLPPKIFGYQEEGEDAALLIEYLAGCTLQDVILYSSEDILENVFFLFSETLKIVWSETLRYDPSDAQYLRQLESRQEDVFKVHPFFRLPRQELCGLSVPSLAERIEHAKRIGEKLIAPCSVFIHGDFNINNILYNHKDQRIHYIDLYRSKDTDYIQDVSVFLVSNFRIPVQDAEMRRKLNWMSGRFLEFARDFAKELSDTTFEARLCMGLIRSFMTSTRFEFKRTFAKEMFTRGVYLLDHFLAHEGKPWEELTVPEEILYS